MIKYHFNKIGIVCLLLLSAALASGQDAYQVTGHILNSSSEAVRDVAVSFDGSTSAPFITDSTGYFELNVPHGDVWISVTPVGSYKTKSVFLNGRTDFTIYVANLDSKSVYDEVLYQGQDELSRNVVPTIYSATPAKLPQDSYESVDQKLQGKVSGLHQVGMSGMPGSGTYMLIRGLNSISSNNQPLVIVDGMPLETPGLIASQVDGYTSNPMSSLDINDISNITIISDGAPLASYGVKGGNGVILIETLKPAETTTSIDFQVKTGIHSFTGNIPSMKSDQYKTFAKEVITTSPYQEEEYKERYPGLYYVPYEQEYLRYSHETQWQKEVFQNSLMYDAYLTVKGGDAIARYGLSVGYLNHSGIFENTNYNRFNTRFVGTFNIFNWLRMYVSANLVSANSAYKESALSEETSPLLSAFHKTPQMYPFAYDQDGKLLTTIDEVDELGVSNPRAVMDNYSAANSNYRFLTSIRIEGDLAKNLKLISLLGLNINDMKEKVFKSNRGMELYQDGEAYNISQSLNNFLFTMFNDNYLNYKNTFNGIHALNTSLGFRWQTNDYQADLGQAGNSAENDQYTNLQAGESELRDIQGDNGKWNWLSTYANASYAFKDRYLLDAGMAGDFSSRVGQDADNVVRINDRPFGLFYNVGLAWRLSGESFMDGASSIEDLRLKVNYGTSGNDDIGNYSSYAYYRLKLYRETSGMIPGGFPNSFITFETIKQLSTGISLSMWENRLMLQANYYSSNTDNMLIYEQLNSYLGYDVFPSNNATMEKTGYDAGLTTRIVQKGNFAFDLGLTISHYESIITDIPDGEIISDLPGGAQLINRIGSPANSFYGYEYDGVFSTQAEAMEAGLMNDKGIPFRAGDARFVDRSGPDGIPDQVINEYDKTILGSATPDFVGGASVSLFYKRFRFDMFWQFVTGNEVYNYLRYQNEKMTDLSNQSTAVLNRWVTEGQVTEIPRAVWDDPMGNSSFSSRWIEDGSYIRLKEVSLSYDIPGGVGFMKKLGFFITGSNLLTFSNYLSFDPEFAYSFDPMLQGIDYGLMPMGRRVMIGVKFGL